MKRNAWTVTVAGYGPFTMVGEPRTQEQALQVARSIWPGAEVRP